MRNAAKCIRVQSDAESTIVSAFTAFTAAVNAHHPCASKLLASCIVVWVCVCVICVPATMATDVGGCWVDCVCVCMQNAITVVVVVVVVACAYRGVAIKQTIQV